jgi:phosphoenolpyruvate carboxylase
MMNELASLAEDAYRRLVWEDPDFARFFTAATPIDEISRMELGSRPARRGASGSLDTLRAIPWVFAWSQSRMNLPAWYGVGSALAVYVERHPNGRRHLADAYRDWPFCGSLVDNVELGLAIADPTLAAHYAGLAGDAPGAGRIADLVEEERSRTVAEVVTLTGSDRLLDRSPRLRRSIDLRMPYVDVLSELQVHALGLLRGGSLDAGERAAADELLRLTVSGVAAGLQHTG